MRGKENAREVEGNTRNEIRVDCEKVNPARHGRVASTVLIATTHADEK